MLRYELISPKLIVSRTAYHFYRVSACLSILLFVGLCIVISGGSVPGMMAPIAQPLLLIFALATASTIVGMEIFLFRFDNSQPLKQVFWFCVMLLPLLGAAAYCFLVYSRSNLFKARDEQAQSASV
jgi:hypothetical protein